jgi:hypothetical protein
MMMMDGLIDFESGSIYQRELPGGGYVKIDVNRKARRSSVSVERRAKEERRPGHQPVVIAEVEGDVRSAAVGDLDRMAADHAAIARRMLEIEGPQRAD